jgi:hypothetical protein
MAIGIGLSSRLLKIERRVEGEKSGKNSEINQDRAVNLANPAQPSSARPGLHVYLHQTTLCSQPILSPTGVVLCLDVLPAQNLLRSFGRYDYASGVALRSLLGYAGFPQSVVPAPLPQTDLISLEQDDLQSS